MLPTLLPGPARLAHSAVKGADNRKTCAQQASNQPVVGRAGAGFEAREGHRGTNGDLL